MPDGGGAAQQALFQIAFSGVDDTRQAQQGNVAPGSAPATFRSFLAVTNSDQSFYRATLSGSPRSMNEGVWSIGFGLLLRKGAEFDAANHPGLVVTRIVRFWGLPGGQGVVHATSGGTGVTRANNQALLLRQNNGDFLILLRTCDPAPGVGRSGATVGSIQAVDLHPVNGHHVVLGSVKGAPKTANQALWTGQTTLGDDTSANQQLRLPRLRLLKGDAYSSTATPRDMIRGIRLKPAVERTGAGGRGLAQAIGRIGHIVVCIIGDRRVQELVRLDP